MSKTKLYILILGHLAFWAFNYLYITNGFLSWIGFDNTSGSLGVAYSYGMFFNAFLFYIQVFWLVPIFFIKHKKLKFWLYSLLLLFSVTFLEVYLDIQVMLHFGIINEHVSFILVGISIYIQNFIFHVLYTVFGFFYRFLFEYRKAERTKQELLKETHQTELKYLKAQLNPHFLFNGINSVYHLIGNNDNLAKDTLLQFSDLLRYQLYESSEAFIPLEKELDYVSQYIQLEAIRRGDDISLNYTINFENNVFKIAPLLLTPFIENAFKHVSHHDDAEKNSIQIKIRRQKIILICEKFNRYAFEENRFWWSWIEQCKTKINLIISRKTYLKDYRKEQFL